MSFKFTSVRDYLISIQGHTGCAHGVQWLKLKPTKLTSKTVHITHHANVAMARLSSAGSLVMDALLLILFGTVLKAVSNALDVLACACHGVAAGHDCDCQHGRDDLQVHDPLLKRSPLGGQTLLESR